MSQSNFAWNDSKQQFKPEGMMSSHTEQAKKRNVTKLSPALIVMAKIERAIDSLTNDADKEMVLYFLNKKYGKS